MNFLIFDIRVHHRFKTLHELLPKVRNLIVGESFYCKVCKQRTHKRGFDTLLGPTYYTRCQCGAYDSMTYFTSAFPDVFAYKKNVFNSFFDDSLGVMITSTEQIRNYEREGKIFARHEEISRETAKNKRYIQEKLSQKRKKNIEGKLADLAQGRSFHRELLDKGVMRLN